MKVVILTLGGWGDTLPFIAVGKGLQAAGYEVRIAAIPDFADLVQEHGLAFTPVNVDMRGLLSGEMAQAFMKDYNIIEGVRFFMQAGKDLLAQAFDDFWQAIQGSDAVLYSTVAFAGSAMAEKLGVPCVRLDLYPLYPTREYSNFTMGLPNLGGPLNRATYLTWEWLMWLLFTGSIRRLYRDKLGQDNAPFGGIVRRARLAHSPVMSGFSRSVLPQPTDWPPHVRATGYWFLDPPDGWTPPADLVRFLESGPPPIYVGFGSMANRDAEAVSRHVLDALQATGQRGVLFRGWGGLSAVDVPDTVHLIDPIPHGWLFPRMAAVVHHGGAGTTAAGLRAGVPSMIVPHIVDQFFWGKRVAQLGVGVEPIPRRKLTARKLADAIARAVSDPGIRQRADALGRQIRAEDGVGQAVRCFEKWLERSPGA